MLIKLIFLYSSLITLSTLINGCCTDLEISRDAVFDLVWDFYDYVLTNRATEDGGNACSNVHQHFCTAVIMRGTVQIWGRRPKGTIAEQARRGPDDSESYFANKINVSYARYSTCDEGVVFKRRDGCFWETNLCGYLKNQDHSNGKRKRSQNDASQLESDFDPSYDGCYTWDQPEAKIIGTSDFITAPDNAKAGFRMLLVRGNARIYCCYGYNCNEAITTKNLDCQKVTFSFPADHIPNDKWYDD